MASKRIFLFLVTFVGLNLLVFVINDVRHLVSNADVGSDSNEVGEIDSPGKDNIVEVMRNTGNGRLTNRKHKRPRRNRIAYHEDNAERVDASVPVTTGKTYKIVLYHFFHTLLRNKALKVDMSKCKIYKNCKISHQWSNQLMDADAVILQGNHMPQYTPVRKHPDQVFVYANIESPQYLQYLNLRNGRYQELFNWTMTYRFDSDIPYLYGSIIPRSLSKEEVLTTSEALGEVNNYRNHMNVTTNWPEQSNGLKGKNYDAIFEEKKKFAVWFVSHCGTASKREKYVQKMKTVINVDIFGRCSPQKNICPKTEPNCSGDIQYTYKFVLAYENSLCHDYVTEKLYTRYNLNLITVVLGATNYTRYLPKGTYIDANDFDGPVELAKFMKSVASNKELYLSYIKRKDQYTVITEDEHVQLAYCTLCYRLNHLKNYIKRATPLAQWWHGRGICRNPTALDSKLKPRKR